MTNTASGFARLLLVALAGFVAVQACSAAANSPRGSGNSGGSGGSSGAGGNKVFAPDVSSPPVEGGMGGVNPLCAVDSLNGCTPDDERACSDYVPPSPQRSEWFAAFAGAGGEAGAGGGGGAAGSSGEQGAGGGGQGGQSGAAGASAAGSFGAGGGDGPGAEAGAGGVPGPPAYACRVVRTRSGAASSCAATGRGAVSAPCFTGADCGAGLGCVSEGAVARCRPYCCNGEDSCTPGTYCAERPLQDESVPSSATAPLIPVCVPAENCALLEAFPCVGEQCQCTNGLACMVVRPDGTTACIRPGEGKLDEPCPCAPGFVCSRGTATASCIKLCSTASQQDAGASCATGQCQASAELPAGWGVCVGG